MMGDGAANQGQVYETTNMAALWKLPLILLVENNKYGMGTSAERSSFCTDYYTRGHYVPGIQCDGLDVVSVRATMEFAAEHCRSGKGPIFVEMRTYRYHGHSMSDPGKTYRDKEEVKTYRKTNDAIKNCKNRILELEWATEEELKKIEKKCSIEVEEAAKNAMADEEAHKSDRFVDIYYKEIPKFIRGTDIENSYHRT
ncbi:Pyruvate dehydrogenase E1 component subunit alpha, somatic form, mitochondrial [Bonamia ostreae]|uniref:Pyruvate dehydrogenase E1 component subunit alpha, somatic form, mitochondrial n=1 Tax=Bonamia ostreae TaxID=126728 RepID=A0ABV2AQU4_9EUKA